MNVTKDVINDLIPLYAEKECSVDTCELVEEYLRAHPEQAEELQRIMKAPLPGAVPLQVNSDELRALKRARRLVRLRGWVMGFAIFFSLAPFSILHTGNKTYVLFLEAPAIALGYGLIGLSCWAGYAFMRNRSQAL